MSCVKPSIQIRILLKWGWFISVFAFLVGFITYRYLESVQIFEAYETRSLISFGNILTLSNPERRDLRLSEELSQIYEQLVKRDTVLQGTINALDLQEDIETLSGYIYANVLPETLLLEITVRYPDRELASEINNEIVNQLSLLAPEEYNASFPEQIELAEEQIQIYTAELSDLQADLLSIEGALSLDSPSSNLQLQNQRTNLVNQVNQLNRSIERLSNLLNQLENRTVAITVADFAEIPDGPFSGTNEILATVTGLVSMLMIATVFRFLERDQPEFLDPERFSKILNVPIYGCIYKSRNRFLFTRSKIQTYKAYELLLTNILYVFMRDKQPYISVTRSSDKEDYFTIVTTMAIVAAERGIKTLLIQATEVYQTMLHETNDPKVACVFDEVNRVDVNSNELSQSSYFDDLFFVKLNSNDNDLYFNLDQWLESFVKVYDFQLVVISTGPISDAQILGHSEGFFIFAVDYGKTTLEDIERVQESTQRFNIHIDGIVIN